MQIGSRTLVLNPASGTGTHAASVRRLAKGRGFAVWETETAGDGIRFGRRAAEEGVSELAVCGGDGTINEVLTGLAEGSALSDVTFSVVPAGTANLLARNLGIHDTSHGMAVADTGTPRDVDLGMAAGRPFLVSCIAGLPADASVATSSDLKARLGTFAFVVTGVQEALTFDGLDIDLTTDTGERWSGEAFCVLVGNARRFVEQGGPADMEDGRFDVAIVEQMPASNLVGEAVSHRVLGRETEGVTHLQAASLDIESADGTPITFSLDGELDEHDRVHIETLPGALSLRVPESYERP